jgi:hypothetical protein
MDDIEPYIYEAVKQEDYLPTETEREYQARQKRCEQMQADFAAGKITNINDLITYNLDIRKFAEDWTRGIKDPVTLRAFYFHCLTKVTILDPAVGSGAFLFAALNMLEPLYEICLDKVEELGGSKYPDFAEELARIRQHPNRKYFVLKSIIVNNLFGVDIMEEAVEICKLRLFLKLVSQVDDVEKIEPLPDIDFNIRAGNSLVGYANLDEIHKAKTTQLDLSGALKNIEDKIITADCGLQNFRKLQTEKGIPTSVITQAKGEVKASLKEIQSELDRDLAAFYGARDIKQFVKTHQPFHWFVEFYGIMKNGGFDVIIGNPPYVEYSKVRNTYSVRGYSTEPCGNLFPLVVERAFTILSGDGRCGLILQHSSFCTPRMKELMDLVKQTCSLAYVSFYECRPGKLFDGIDVRLAIPLLKKGRGKFSYFAGRYFRFFTEERPVLFQMVKYVDATDVIQPYSLLKIETAQELSIARKMFIGSKHRMRDHLADESKSAVYYSYGFRYWAKALNFRPYFSGENAEFSTGDKQIFLRSGLNPNTVVCVMNSSLFYWYYSIYSDGHNFTKTVIYDFPFDYPSPKIEKRLSELCGVLMADLRNNAKLKVANYKTTGRIEYGEYYAYKSKPIIDDIDRVLANHYGLTEEELDFIINYDIKYRMGKDNEEEEE